MFYANICIYLPNSLDVALLKRSGSNILIFSISEFFILTDKHTQKLIYQLSQDSKQILNLVSNYILKILNKHVVKEEFMLKPGQLVYIVDLLQAKNPYSILGSLGRITYVAGGGRTYQMKLLNNQSITRHIFS